MRNKTTIKITHLHPNFKQCNGIINVGNQTYIDDFGIRGKYEVGHVERVNNTQLGHLNKLQGFGILKFEKVTE